MLKGLLIPKLNTMYKFKNSFACVGLLIFSMLFIISCGSDDEGSTPDPFPDLNRGDIKVNRFIFTLTLNEDTTQIAQAEFVDPDGIEGSSPPSRIDTLKLRGPVSQGTFRRYSSEIEFFDGNVSVNAAIKNKDDEYVVCYRDMNDENLRFGDRDKDRDGRPLGIKAEWSTAKAAPNTPENGIIRITLNFQPAGKEGLCDPGVRILEAKIPYLVSN